jgi:polar amino acid transport system substrate-binding protein
MRAIACVVLACSAAVLVSAQSTGELRWGGDAEGGAPFVEADPQDPARVVGFDVEVAELLARGLGRTARFAQVGFTSLDAAAARGDFDIGLSGIEDSAARRARLAVTIPYYEFREILTVREADRDRYRTLADLRGRRVATLGATLAYDILVAAQAEHGLIAVTYEDDVHPYSDLALGRVDAVVLDAVLADRGVRRNAGLMNQDADLGVGYYVGVLAPEQSVLRDRMNGILREAMRDGRLEAIFRHWGMWNEDQPRLYARLLAGESVELLRTAGSGPINTWEAARRYFPALLQAAVITLILSCAAMALAIGVGSLIATGRVYGPRGLQALLTAYVEVMRGTPLLVQILFVYFVLPSVGVNLPAYTSGILALTLNAAAYISEVIRAGILSIDAGQMEGARALGMSHWQAMRRIILPQTFRRVVPPLTNEGISLLKDSSLVSVIGLTELARTGQELASRYAAPLTIWPLVALLYLALTFPLTRVSEYLERRWRPITRV